MPKIYDNIENRLTEGLRNTLEVSHRSDFCVGYFNLRGWKEVADNIENLDGGDNNCCRVLIGMQKPSLDIIKEYYSKVQKGSIDNQEAIKIKKGLARDFKDQLTIGYPTEEDEQGLRKLSRQIKDKKVIVKLYLKTGLHAKLYLMFREDNISPVIGFLGSSNLTLAGLAKQGELNIDVLDQDASKKLSQWFNERWNDRWCIDISDELAKIIDESWAGERLFPPYHIYMKIAYHLSQEARAGLTEFKIPKVFKKQLLDFQEKAVLVAARHLNKRDGVIIGDVVGLGKTYVATALAKIFEDDFFLETLIICPKNLTDMWEDYAYRYQLRAKIISISMVQKILPILRRYRLVIIDESHNLRNRKGKRYNAIREYLFENDSKVVLLSATPYNKTYLDLSNQLRLFIPEDKDLGISPENYIESIGGKIEFMARHQTPLRSLPAFEHSEFTDDWRELMRLYLVRRTRSFIKKHYAKEDPDNKRKYLTFSDGSKSYFPDRVPKKVEYPFDPNDPNDQYAKLYDNYVVDIINGLNLPRYGLGNFIDKESKVKLTSQEQVIYDNLSRAGKRLMGFCRTNLFKRLESSGYAFLLSLSRHILRNFIYIYAIENKLPCPIGSQESGILSEFMSDIDLDGTEEKSLSKKLFLNENIYYEEAEKLYDLFSGLWSKRFQWIRSELFDNDLKKQLINDSRDLLQILKRTKSWHPEQDSQLNVLYNLCTKIYAREKILIFTQFADTAYYLRNEFKKRGLKKFACVTGDSDNPTFFAHRFSPVSNDKRDFVQKDDEIRVLISTDVLSEGQNLQDAHIIVNYDLPWALIRLVQRAGRVDRIGQKAEKIFCYSFLPEDGIEQIINLRGRLRSRIGENAEVVGSDETFFDGDPVNIRDLYNEKAGILDDEDDDEVDLASYAFQIWKNAIDNNHSLKKIIPELPNVVYATKKSTDAEDREGVIVYTRTSDNNDILAWMNKKGEIITQSQYEILRTAQCSPDTTALPKLGNHHILVEKGLEHIKDIESTIGGQLGKKSGARYRVYMRLDRYVKEFEDTLFVSEALKRAIEDIYKYPLKEYAKDALNRQLKSGISDFDLVGLVTSLREE
ncbi:MAG: NgoFVII family restriction endonuclease, partial [Deltaproteobacteria bacterium]|nr:NgoFVII family restriction endonuclease [Deltaproteobacteria bacterium]